MSWLCSDAFSLDLQSFCLGAPFPSAGALQAQAAAGKPSLFSWQPYQACLWSTAVPYQYQDDAIDFSGI